MPIHPEAPRRITNIDTPLRNETHQLEPKTHQLQAEKHQLEDIIDKENLPGSLKLKLNSLNKRPKNEELKLTICELCAWRPLTAQQIAEILNRKNKKYLVRQYLTPLVKEGALKYVYPERGNSPNQAYINTKRF